MKKGRKNGSRKKIKRKGSKRSKEIKREEDDIEQEKKGKRERR